MQIPTDSVDPNNGASSPATIQLPSWTDHAVPGVHSYYALSNTIFRGIYTNWNAIGPVVHSIQGANCVRRSTYAEAVEAMEASAAVETILTQLAQAAIDPMDPNALASLPEGLLVLQSEALPHAAVDTTDVDNPPASASTDSTMEDAPTPAPTNLVPATPVRVHRGGRPRSGWTFFAVARGRERGIFESAEEMTAMISTYPNGLAKGFRTREEAEMWLEDHPV
ncbi:hypothetical protein BV25DRAFT_1916454 [Artomyces pyxidatus]|uniref:Uncharacterized protein n=1 Tax=Artomyces pyxidatus TaxID=48021 RepID=A0ACB8T0Z4_9AGAM|nr:hypothetical protein BV25DRAFT_1916454 [Artomyces pyxidatus]